MDTFIAYEISAHNLCIRDAYRVRKCDMRGWLKKIREAEPGSEVWRRSLFSLKMEWLCHKCLYLLGYQRARTRDADLDNPCDRPEWVYCLCGIIIWLFVW